MGTWAVRRLMACNYRGVIKASVSLLIGKAPAVCVPLARRSGFHLSFSCPFLCTWQLFWDETRRNWPRPFLLSSLGRAEVFCPPSAPLLHISVPTAPKGWIWGISDPLGLCPVAAGGKGGGSSIRALVAISSAAGAFSGGNGERRWNCPSEGCQH